MAVLGLKVPSAKQIAPLSTHACTQQIFIECLPCATYTFAGKTDNNPYTHGPYILLEKGRQTKTEIGKSVRWQKAEKSKAVKRKDDMVGQW